MLGNVGATSAAPQTAPGLQAWIDSASDWELHRRQGRDRPLRPPDVVIDPTEDAVSIAAATAMPVTVVQGSRSR